MKKHTLAALGIAVLTGVVGVVNAEPEATPPAQAESEQATPAQSGEKATPATSAEQPTTTGDATTPQKEKSQTAAPKKAEPAMPQIGSKKAGVHGRGLPKAFSGE